MGKNLTIAKGSLEGSGLRWQIKADKRATSHDLRSIAALLIAAANKLGPTFFVAGLPLPSAAQRAYILGETDVPAWGGNEANASSGDST